MNSINWTTTSQINNTCKNSGFWSIFMNPNNEATPKRNCSKIDILPVVLTQSLISFNRIKKNESNII